MYTNLLIPADVIAAQLAETTATLSYAGAVVGDRLRQRPDRYLEFGPYWWAVKAALADAGQDFGADADPVILQAYGGALPSLDALVAGELFKDGYRTQYLAGTAVFQIGDGELDTYLLYDVDMEARRLGRPGLVVSANLSAIPEPDTSEAENPAVIAAPPDGR